MNRVCRVGAGCKVGRDQIPIALAQTPDRSRKAAADRHHQINSCEIGSASSLEMSRWKNIAFPAANIGRKALPPVSPSMTSVK
jgi:hypothetical protein